MLALEAKTGVKNPRLLTRPQIRTDCATYRDAYKALSNARQYNQAGVQPLTIAEVLAYAELAQIPKGYQTQKLLRIVQSMDNAHLEWWAKKQK